MVIKPFFSGVDNENDILGAKQKPIYDSEMAELFLLPENWVSKSVDQVPNTLSNSIIPVPIQTRNKQTLEKIKEFANTPPIRTNQQKGGVIQGKTGGNEKNTLSEDLIFSKEFFIKCLKNRLTRQMKKYSKFDQFAPKNNQNGNGLLSKDDVEKILSDNIYR